MRDRWPWVEFETCDGRRLLMCVDHIVAIEESVILDEDDPELTRIHMSDGIVRKVVGGVHEVSLKLNPVHNRPAATPISEVWRDGR